MTPQEIHNATASIINGLYSNGKPNKAAMASFRNAPNFTSKLAHQIWPLVFGKLDESAVSSDGNPTYAELAVFTAVHLYALHQQGKQVSVYQLPDVDGSKQQTPSLFAQLARMRTVPDKQKPLDANVNRTLDSSNFSALVNNLTHLIGQLKANKSLLVVDYAQLAADIYRFQFSYESAVRVKTTWGRQYYRVINVKNEEGEQKND